MNYSREKDQPLVNSKLEMSIRPFTTIREDTSREKSGDKNRRALSKGISRVSGSSSNVLQQSGHNFIFTSSKNNLHQVPGSNQNENTSNFNFTLPEAHKFASTQPHIGRAYQSHQQHQMEKTLPPEHHNMEPEKWAVKLQRQNESLRVKIDQLETELVVIERQNSQFEKQTSRLNKQCQEFYHLKLDYQSKLSQMINECKDHQKRYDEKMAEISHKDKMIEKLLNEGRQNRLQSEQAERKLKEQLERKIIELQNEIYILNRQQQSGKSNNQIIAQLQEETRKAKEESFEARQRYRQLLIKMSALESERDNYEQVVAPLQQQRDRKERTILALEEQLQKLVHQLQSKSSLIEENHRYYQQLQQLRNIAQQNSELQKIIQDDEIRIKDLEKRRLSQIEYHQEEIRKIQSISSQRLAKQQSKLIQQRNDALIRINQLEQQLNSHQSRNKQMIGQMTQDYQNLIFQIKGKLTQAENIRHQREVQHKSELESKSKEIQKLIQKLSELEEEKDLLLNKIRERNESSAFRSGSIQKDYLSASKSELERSRRHSIEQIPQSIELTRLQEKNKEINKKIKQYQMQMIKLEDKIHLVQIESQKNLDKAETYERKLRHLQQEIAHYQSDREKVISEKVRLIEQIQIIKRDNKQREECANAYQLKNKELNQKISSLEISLSRTSQEENLYLKKNQQLNHELHLKIQFIQSLQEENNIMAERYNSIIKRLQQSEEVAAKKQQERASLRQCIDLLKVENQTIKEKNKVKQIIVQQDSEEIKQVRIGLLEKIYIAFGAQKLFVRDPSQEIAEMRKLISIAYEQAEKNNKYLGCISQLQRQLREKGDKSSNDELLKSLLIKKQQKCEELEKMLSNMEAAHCQKLKLVKEDYDIVYAKYLKYRNMVISKQGLIYK